MKLKPLETVQTKKREETDSNGDQRPLVSYIKHMKIKKTLQKKKGNVTALPILQEARIWVLIFPINKTFAAVVS